MPVPARGTSTTDGPNDITGPFRPTGEMLPVRETLPVKPLMLVNLIVVEFDPLAWMINPVNGEDMAKSETDTVNCAVL